MMTDTIAAIATARTNSGIGIIRMSGENAVETADRMIRLKSGKRLSDCSSHTVHYGFVTDADHTVDEVMVLLMKAPKSYTREDTVEINCHGGTLVMERILELAIRNGARPADPGEFTKRAFLNGRMDLAQAESVIDLINAQNDFALRASIDQLEGSVSEVIRKIRAEILHELALIEAALDDPEHYQLLDVTDELSDKTDRILKEIGRLLENARNGSVLKEGIRTAIVGRPNSGKSTLLNSLLGRERAIVTDIAGTTRDIIEEQVRFNGISLHVMDTAGIRSTEDAVEKIGVEKAMESVEKSDLVLYVADASVPLDDDDRRIIKLIRNRNVIVLLNKSDLDCVTEEKDICRLLNKEVFCISAKYKEGIEKLFHAIEEMFFHGKIKMNDEVYITNARHKAALLEAENSLRLVQKSISEGLPEDFYTIDLMNAYEQLGRVIGEAVEDDLVNEIFGKFCMGK